MLNEMLEGLQTENNELKKENIMMKEKINKMQELLS